MSLILVGELFRSRDAARMSRPHPLHQMMQTGAGALRLTQEMLYTRRNQLHLGCVGHQLSPAIHCLRYRLGQCSHRCRDLI